MVLISDVSSHPVLVINPDVVFAVKLVFQEARWIISHQFVIIKPSFLLSSIGHEMQPFFLPTGLKGPPTSAGCIFVSGVSCNHFSRWISLFQNPLSALLVVNSGVL